MGVRVTNDGLPIVTKDTFMELLESCDIGLDPDPEIAQRIESENPQIHRLIRYGVQGALNEDGRKHYEQGIQLVYELLRLQSRSDSGR